MSQTFEEIRIYIRHDGSFGDANCVVFGDSGDGQGQMIAEHTFGPTDTCQDIMQWLVRELVRPLARPLR
jgi:hypothetical protein